MMKNFITGAAFLLISAGGSMLYAQSAAEMKKQIETLKLQTEILNKKIDLENERTKNEKLKNNADKINAKADRRTGNYSSSDDPSATANDAKNAAKLLKETESANRDLQRSATRMVDLTADIQKLQIKLDRQPYQVEITRK